MRRTPVLVTMVFVLVVLVASVALFGCAAKANGKVMKQISDHFASLQTLDEKYAYLKDMAKKYDNHAILFNLGYIAVAKGDVNTAKKYFLDDIRKNGDLFEQYESYSMLIGLYNDNGMKIDEKFVKAFLKSYHAMVKKGITLYKNSEKELAKIESKLKNSTVQSDKLKAKYDIVKNESAKFAQYSKDPYQALRMLGDYYTAVGDMDRALEMYDAFYADLDKPIDSFSPEPMRKYISLLIKKGDKKKALLYFGYLVNLGPAMYADLFALSEFYGSEGDFDNEVFTLLLINAQAQEANGDALQRANSAIAALLAKIGTDPQYQRLVNLVSVYFTGKNSGTIPTIVNGFKDAGIDNVFFNYLLGLSAYIAKNGAEALTRFTEFNARYPYIADSHYYVALAMISADKNTYRDAVIKNLETAIQLKPASKIAMLAKTTLGGLIGLGEADSAKLLTGYELALIFGNFMKNGSPVESFAPVVELLTLPSNPYQIAAIQLFSRVTDRKAELADFLKLKYVGLKSVTGKKNVEQALESLGMPLK